MSWIGVESAEDDRSRSRKARSPVGPTRRDWLLRVRLDGKVMEARLLRLSEAEAHAYARKLARDYVLQPAP